CPHCGAAASRTTPADAEPRKCPRCRVEMESAAVGQTSIRECMKCNGLWIEVDSFEQICASREQQAVVLGAATFVPDGKVLDDLNKIRYVPCPVCGQLMNRVNFARCSGVIIDVCKGHGSWFDMDELRKIIEFIRAGGMDAARAKEKREIEDERRLLRQEQLSASSGGSTSLLLSGNESERTNVVLAARELLKLLTG
ncbi:MAG: zf-TFIIB domain-containing protein, partial [Pyrinomonadaceae bacterium]